MLLFAGADLSILSSGIVIIDEKYRIVNSLLLEPPKSSYGVERLFFLHQLFQDILNKHNINYFCIESPAMGTKDGRLFDIGEWNGIFKLELFNKGIPFITAAPTQLKKYATGTGRGDKNVVMLDIYKNFGEEIRQNDLADGYVLSRIMRDYYFDVILEKALQIKKYQREVLDSIKKLHLTKSLL